MDEKIPMLPLRHTPKPKLPKAFAWITGIEQVSKRFEDVPQFHNLEIYFSDHPHPNWHPTMTRIVAEKISYPVFSAHYCTHFSMNWYFSISPVIASQRHFIRNLLEEQAFPIVEQWMKKERTEVWLISSHELRCIWNPALEKITTQEK